MRIPRFCWYESCVIAIICISLTVGLIVVAFGGPNPWEEDREDRIFAEQRAAEKDAMKPENQLISELRGLRIAAERIAAALEDQNKGKRFNLFESP